MDSCQPPAHPGWPSMGSPRRVRRCPWTCSDRMLATRRVYSWSYRDLRWVFRHEHLKMSSPAGTHTCSWYVICSPDYSGAGMSVAATLRVAWPWHGWCARTGSSQLLVTRQVWTLATILGTQIFEHRSSRRSSAVVGFLCRGLPIVELALLGPWRWVMPCRSQKVQFDVWHLRKQIFENIENSRNGLISEGVTISSKCQFTTCS